jgi:hypothetical protein
MMTYGVSELERSLNEKLTAIGVEGIGVTYDYDADIIRINPWCSQCKLEGTEQACGEVIRKIRAEAFLRKDGKPPAFGTRSVFFEQAGYSMTGAPKELRQQIDKMFVVSVDIHFIHCEAPLLGTGYSVKRE